MAVVLVNDLELKRIKNSQYLNVGDEGTCYLYKNLVFKLYHDLIYNRKIYFNSFESDLIAFPKDILLSYENKKVLGYTMNYMGGQNIKNGFSENMKLSILKKSYMELKAELEKFRNIDMNNISLTNILYDETKEKLQLIDTSLWIPNGDSYFNNLEIINHMLINALSINLDWNRYLLNCDKELFELYGLYKNGYSYFVEFLELLEIKVKQVKNKEIKLVKDLLL